MALFNGEGANDGEFGPFPVTGKTVSVPFCEVAEVNRRRQGDPDEVYYDMAAMLQELGHMPAPDAS